MKVGDIVRFTRFRWNDSKRSRDHAAEAPLWGRVTQVRTQWGEGMEFNPLFGGDGWSEGDTDEWGPDADLQWAFNETCDTWEIFDDPKNLPDEFYQGQALAALLK